MPDPQDKIFIISTVDDDIEYNLVTGWPGDLSAFVFIVSNEGAVVSAKVINATATTESVLDEGRVLKVDKGAVTGTSDVHVVELRVDSVFGGASTSEATIARAHMSWNIVFNPVPLLMRAGADIYGAVTPVNLLNKNVSALGDLVGGDTPNPKLFGYTWLIPVYKRFTYTEYSTTSAELTSFPAWIQTVTAQSSVSVDTLRETVNMPVVVESISTTVGTSLQNTRFISAIVSAVSDAVSNLAKGKFILVATANSLASVFVSMDTKDVMAASPVVAIANAIIHDMDEKIELPSGLATALADSSISTMHSEVSFEAVIVSPLADILPLELPLESAFRMSPLESLGATSAAMEKRKYIGCSVEGISSISGSLIENSYQSSSVGAEASTFSDLHINTKLGATAKALSIAFSAFSFESFLLSHPSALSDISAVLLGQVDLGIVTLGCLSDSFGSITRRMMTATVTGASSVEVAIDFQVEMADIVSPVSGCYSRLGEVSEITSEANSLSGTVALMEPKLVIKATSSPLGNVEASVDRVRDISAEVDGTGRVWAEFWNLPLLHGSSVGLATCVSDLWIPYSGLHSTVEALGTSPSRLYNFEKVSATANAIAHVYAINSFSFDKVTVVSESKVVAVLGRSFWEEIIGDHLEIEIY